MKKLLILTLLFATLSFVSAKADVYVRGYTRSNGTYVEPYYRSNPDGIKWNNKSYRGY